jgi:hypothetical protein
VSYPTPTTLASYDHPTGLGLTDTEAYLTDIFKRIPFDTTRTIHRLTPKAWAAEQAALRQAMTQTAAVPM